MLVLNSLFPFPLLLLILGPQNHGQHLCLGFRPSVNLYRNDLVLKDQSSQRCNPSTSVAVMDIFCPLVYSLVFCFPFQSHSLSFSPTVSQLHEMDHIKIGEARPYGSQKPLSTFHSNSGWPCCDYWNINGNLSVAIESKFPLWSKARPLLSAASWCS